ncbi:hypothetical protein O0235_11985 [Tepidiforma flava]|uniref:Uncharacterized protein n=1 Tax=Tepidiforma flava TaxID=3004094 RepID=A0ABY7M4N7_9CHLR|nr:hypothetical protein [Tepidiforma flava]WBL35489.1 hypothetical protein O0235_11985 [Tepidiforma flava]
MRPEPGSLAQRALLAAIVLAMVAASLAATFESAAARAASGVYRFFCG